MTCHVNILYNSFRLVHFHLDFIYICIQHHNINSKMVVDRLN